MMSCNCNAVMCFAVIVVDICVQPTVVKVLEYHINWMEKTGFTLEQVHCSLQQLTDVAHLSLVSASSVITLVQYVGVLTMWWAYT